MASEFDPRYLAPIATSAGIAVSLVLFLLNLNTKELTYEIVARAQLVTVEEELEADVKIVFHGETVHNVQLLSVRVMNSGTVPIKSSDVDGRLQLVLPEGTRILTAEVIEMNPSTLKERSSGEDGPKDLIESVQGNRVVLRPVLLNRKDSFTIKILATPRVDSVALNGHIEVSTPQQLRSVRAPESALWMIFARLPRRLKTKRPMHRFS